MKVNVGKSGLIIVPDVGWGSGAEFLFVKFLHPSVKGVKLLLFGFTTFCWVVVNFCVKCVFAKICPVRFGVSEVQVPCLVYRVAGCNSGR